MGERRARSDNMNKLTEYTVRVVIEDHKTPVEMRHAIVEGLADNCIKCRFISVSEEEFAYIEVDGE